MVDIIEVSAIVAAAGVLVGVIYYILDLRHQSKMRQTDLTIRMNPWLNVSGSELTDAIATLWSLQYKDYDDFVKRYGAFALDKPETKALQKVLNYFEGIGMLLKRNLMSTDFAWDLFGSTYFPIWEKVKPVVEGVRKQYVIQDTWNFFENLFNEMKKREQQLASKTA